MPRDLLAEMRPARVWQGGRFRCGVAQPASDVDNDVLDYQVRWFLDGEPYEGAVIHDCCVGDTLPAGVAQPGESRVCEITADDGTTQGSPVSASVIIESSPGGNVLLILVDDAGIDKIAVSFLSVLADPSAKGGRERVIIDRFQPNGPPPYTVDEWMVRDLRYMLIQFDDGSEALYALQGVDVEGDALDFEQLTEEQSLHCRQLTQALARERGARVYAAP